MLIVTVVIVATFTIFSEIRRQSLAVPTLEGALGVRRHSVPVNVEPALPRTIYRRESLPTGRGTGKSPVSPIAIESRASSGLREFGSQSSVVSSGSPHYSSGQFRHVLLGFLIFFLYWFQVARSMQVVREEWSLFIELFFVNNWCRKICRGNSVAKWCSCCHFKTELFLWHINCCALCC